MFKLRSVSVISETVLKLSELTIKVTKFSFNVAASELETEESFLEMLRPELNKICFNSVRASIIHILFNSKELGYTLSVERIAHKIGKRHSVVLYHLEKLSKWKIVKVAKKYEYGIRERRSLWGLNNEMPDLVSEVYSYMLKTFYTIKELNDICSINKNVRKAS